MEFAKTTLPDRLPGSFTTSGPSSSMCSPAAQVTEVIATQITVDVGSTPPTGGGIEVRRTASDERRQPGAPVLQAGASGCRSCRAFRSTRSAPVGRGRLRRSICGNRRWCTWIIPAGGPGRGDS